MDSESHASKRGIYRNQPSYGIVNSPAEQYVKDSLGTPCLAWRPIGSFSLDAFVISTRRVGTAPEFDQLEREDRLPMAESIGHTRRSRIGELLLPRRQQAGAETSF